MPSDHATGPAVEAKSGPPAKSREGLTDLVLASVTFALVIIGLVMVYSASSPLALQKYHDPAHYAIRNGVYAMLGTFILASMSRLSVDAIRVFGRIGFWISLASLALVLVPGIGIVGGGARRWINFHLFTFQPSELFKVMMVLFVAHFIAVDPSRVTRLRGGLIPLVLVFSVGAALLMAEPDFGATLLVGAVMMGMVFMAGIPWGWVVLLLFIAIPAAALGVIMAPYRFLRVTSFLNPWDDPLDSDFQLVQSLLAFGNGGVQGTGLGQGQQKQFYLPESHTDFILAVIGEELGLFWVLILIGLFGTIIWRALRIARYSRDPFAAHAASGLALLLGAQALANMGVVMGLLPPKGLTLPLVSFGGSSLIVSMMAIGILLSLSRTASFKGASSPKGPPRTVPEDEVSHGSGS